MVMTKNNIIKKNIKLGLEFDRYAFRHPEIFDQINNSWVIITDARDKEFSNATRSWIKNAPTKGKVVEARKQGKTWVIEKLPSIK
jgi:hypothetical protein